MALFRRRAQHEPDPSVVAFRRVAGRVDAAQRALLAAIPTPRNAGIPLGQALLDFRVALDELDLALGDWHDERVAARREACVAAVQAARTEAARLRLESGLLSFEALNARVGDILHPLGAFVEAERSMRGRA